MQILTMAEALDGARNKLGNATEGDTVMEESIHHHLIGGVKDARQCSALTDAIHG
jgi:hypothetical protein